MSFKIPFTQPLLFLFSCLLITACTHSGTDVLKKDYNPNTDARIRVYGQNGNPTIMHVGIDCATNPKGSEINIGGALDDAFDSFLGRSHNESIGIAQTEISANVADRSGMLSQAFYRELIIPANKPVNIRPGVEEVGRKFVINGIPVYNNTCKTTTISFIPQAGKDYEAVGLRQGAGCHFFISEITNEAGAISEIRTLDNQPPFSCE